MKTIESSQTNRRRRNIRIAATTLCILAGLSGVLLTKKKQLASRQSSTPAQSVVTSPSQATIAQLVSKMPPSTGNSETDKAVKDVLAKLQKNPRDPLAWVNAGDALAQKMRDTNNEKYYDVAEIAYQQALNLSPESVDAMTGLSWVYGGRHLFDQSIDWAHKALALDPRNPSANGIIGDAAFELGDYENAFSAYQEMMDAKPDLSSWSRGAYLLWTTGNTIKAKWLMQKAIDSGAPFAENTAWCRAKFAMMLFSEGALLPAEQILEPALKAAPQNIHVLLAAAKISVAQGRYDAAETYYQSVLKSGPQHDALVGLGELETLRNHPDAAEKYYSQVETLYQNHLTTTNHSHLNVARFYADHDRNLVEALRIAEQSKLSKNVFTADTVAWVYYKNGDLPRAVEAIKRALAQNTFDPEIHYHAGMIAAKFGDLNSAKRHLETAVGLNPNFNSLQAITAADTLKKLSSGKYAIQK